MSPLQVRVVGSAGQAAVDVRALEELTLEFLQPASILLVKAGDGDVEIMTAILHEISHGD